MRLTEEAFLAGKSDKRRLIASEPEISDEAYRQFLALRNKHLGPQKIARIAARRSLQESFKEPAAHLRSIMGKE